MARPWTRAIVWRTCPGGKFSSSRTLTFAVSAWSSSCMLVTVSSMRLPWWALRSWRTTLGTPSLSARWDSVTIRRSARPLCRLTPPPTSTAYFSRNRRPGVVRRVSRMRVLVPLTALANLAVWLAIPERCCRKFRAVRSARSTLTAGPETRATSWPPASAMPSVARGSKEMLLSTSSNTRLKIGKPARTPSSLAISLPRALTFPGNSDSVVRSPSPTSSASASLISLSTALIGKRMVMTGGAAGRGWGGGGGRRARRGRRRHAGRPPGGPQGRAEAEDGGPGEGHYGHAGRQRRLHRDRRDRWRWGDDRGLAVIRKAARGDRRLGGRPRRDHWFMGRRRLLPCGRHELWACRFHGRLRLDL